MSNLRLNLRGNKTQGSISKLIHFPTGIMRFRVFRFMPMHRIYYLGLPGIIQEEQSIPI